MDTLASPFLGSEAVRAGLVTKLELRTAFTQLLPDVYKAPSDELSIEDHARAAWLWSHREGVIAGLAAAALHGAKWIDDDTPVELIWPNARPPEGLRTHDYRLASDELTVINGMRVTSVERTAFDIGRQGKRGVRVARLDALGNATGFTAEDVSALASGHRGVRGLRRLREGLAYYDPGAESPKETWLRMMLTDNGFPRPQTQIPVPWPSGRTRYRLDMGWEDIKVAVEYDGEHHLDERASYTEDIVRLEYIQSLGWIVVRVVKEHLVPDIVRRVAAARASRLL